MLSIVFMGLLLLVILLLIGVPLPFCFGGALVFIATFADISIIGLVMYSFTQIISPTLLACPMFILAGSLLDVTGIIDKLLDFTTIIFGRFKGAIGFISIITCALIGAVSGSAFSGIAAVGPALLPKMLENGYSRGYAAALMSSASILGLLIPPSLILIIYGWLTGTSVLACFLSTVGPGFLLILFLSILNYLHARKISISSFKNNTTQTGIDKTVSSKTASKHILFRKLFIAIPGLMMPVIILGGIYGGIFTPTEAAAVAVFAALFIGFFIYKTLNYKKFTSVFKKSATSIGSILSMILFCLMVSQTLVLLQVPQKILQLFSGMLDNKVMILILVNVIFLFVGMIENSSSAMILLCPIFLPLVIKIGVSPVQFAAIICINLGMGGLTPPYATVMYLGMNVCECKFEEIFWPIMKFLLFAFLPVLILTTYWPPLSLWLPSLLGY